MLTYLRRDNFPRYAFVIHKLGLKDTYAKQVGRAVRAGGLVVCTVDLVVLVAFFSMPETWVCLQTHHSAIKWGGDLDAQHLMRTNFAVYACVSAVVGGADAQERYDKYRVGTRLGTPAEPLKRYGSH